MEKRVERYNLHPGFLWGKQPLMQKIVIIQWNTVRSPYPPKNQEWYLMQLWSWRIITSQKQRHKFFVKSSWNSLWSYPLPQSPKKIFTVLQALQTSALPGSTGGFDQTLFASLTPVFLIQKFKGCTWECAFLTKWPSEVMLWFGGGHTLWDPHSENHRANFFSWPNGFLPILWLSPNKSSFSQSFHAHTHPSQDFILNLDFFFPYGYRKGQYKRKALVWKDRDSDLGRAVLVYTGANS